MMESQSKVNPIIIESLKKVERLFRIKARIVDAINAKIQVERDKIASLEKGGEGMNNDIRLSVEFFDHPKTVKLQRRLGVGAVICRNGFGFGRLKIVQTAC